MTKEGWILFLCLGMILMIAAMPAGRKGGTENFKNMLGSYMGNSQDGETKTSMPAGAYPDTGISPESKTREPDSDSYEAVLEKRVKEVLGKVDGVGEVDVLIVLKSSEEKIYRTDGKNSLSSTKEQDSSGGTREVSEQEQESNTVVVNTAASVTSSGVMPGPVLEKELYPEISGIVVSAQGGGSPGVKSEITDAMVALFGLPAHKIKVLKRVE